MAKILLGLTGSFGSGCTEIASRFLAPLGYHHLSLSGYLRALFRERFSTDREPTRPELQQLGTQIRKEKGPDYLATCAVKEVENSGHDKWVIECIRNPHEAEALRQQFSRFFLIAIRSIVTKR